jgi:sterol desaturase/sphingolipid hydroxylase (fatty acid hydroxylase superfamily)
MELAFTNDDHRRFTFHSGLVYAVFFWLHIFFLAAVERIPSLQRYKIQRGKQPSQELVRECWITVTLSHAFTVPLALWFGFGFFEWRGMRFTPGDWTGLEAAAALIFYHAAFDTYFYWGHRLLHHPFLYAAIHKQHHRFNTPVGLASMFAHPAEDLLVNLGSTFVGPLLFPGHVDIW